MTPYTIRERRANIAAHRHAEAFPGQREQLLRDLIEFDRLRAMVEADLAVEARRGAAEIRRKSVKRAAVHVHDYGATKVPCADPKCGR